MAALAVIFGIFLGGLITAFVFLAGGLFIYGASVTLFIYAIGGVLMWFGVRLFWRLTDLFPEDRQRFGVLIPIPALVLGILILQSQPLLLRTLEAPAIVSLGSWLLWMPLIGFLSAIKGGKTK